MSTSITIRADIDQTKILAIAMIAEITGEDPKKLESISEEEILDILGFLIKCEKEQIKELLREHDNIRPLNAHELNRFWKLIGKGVVKNQNKEFATISNKVYEEYKVIAGILIREAILRSMHNVGRSVGSYNPHVGNLATRETESPIISTSGIRHMLEILTQKLQQSNDLVKK
jgi:hypothetical protein